MASLGGIEHFGSVGAAKLGEAGLQPTDDVFAVERAVGR
jgi:hypothetical protein